MWIPAKFIFQKNSWNFNLSGFKYSISFSNVNSASFGEKYPITEIRRNKVTYSKPAQKKISWNSPNEEWVNPQGERKKIYLHKCEDLPFCRLFYYSHISLLV